VSFLDQRELWARRGHKTTNMRVVVVILLFLILLLVKLLSCLCASISDFFSFFSPRWVWCCAHYPPPRSSSSAYLRKNYTWLLPHGSSTDIKFIVKKYCWLNPTAMPIYYPPSFNISWEKKTKPTAIIRKTKQRIIFIIHTYTQSNCFTYYQAKFHPHEYSIVQTYY